MGLEVLAKLRSSYSPKLEVVPNWEMSWTATVALSQDGNRDRHKNNLDKTGLDIRRPSGQCLHKRSPKNRNRS